MRVSRFLPGTRTCLLLLTLTGVLCAILAFHHKVIPLAWRYLDIDPAKCREQVQLGFRFANPLPDTDVRTLTVLEDGVALRPTSRDEVTAKGAGRFAATARNLWISSTDGSDLRTNGRRYVVKFPLSAPGWILWTAASGWFLALAVLLWRTNIAGALREVRGRQDSAYFLLLATMAVLALPTGPMPAGKALANCLIVIWSVAGIVLALRQHTGESALETRVPLFTWWLNHYAQLRPNGMLLGLFRISFGLLSAILAARALELFDLLYHRIDHVTLRGTLRGLVILWLLVGLSMAAGVGGRWVRGINLILGILLLRSFPTFGSIFDATYLFGAWLVFLTPCDGRFAIGRKPRPPGGSRWLDSTLPVYCVGFHFGLALFCAGIDKVFCPLWMQGEGFYNFACLPWILPPHLDGLTEYPWLMQLGNWGGMVIELGFFPLWLWSRTRMLAIAAGFAFLLSLLWPFNVYLIAPLGVSLMLGLCSILWSDGHMPGTQQTDARYMAWGAVPVFSALLLLSELSGTLFPPTQRTMLADLPKFRDPLELTVQKPEIPEACLQEILVDLDFRDFSKPWDALMHWAMTVRPYRLFSKHHTLGMYGYRVVITMADGSRVEPVQYFTPTKERGEAHDGWCEINLLIGMVYGIGDLARLLSHGGDDLDTRTHIERFWMIPLMDYSRQHLTPIQAQQARIVTLLVAPYQTSIEFKGQLHQRDDDWVDFFVLDLPTGSYHYKTMVNRHEVQGRDIRLPDYLPYFYERSLFPEAPKNPNR